MDFLELCEKRYSSRKYLDKTVEREKIEKCLEASRLAPSAVNAQPWSFIVIDDPDLKEKVARETFDVISSFNKFTLTAPVLVAIVNENPVVTSFLGRFAQGRDYTLMDVGIVASYFCLKATEEGLGTCILGYYNEKNVKNILKIPKNKSVSLIISLGYPADSPRKKNRKPIEKIRRYNI
ncbi:MAG: dihydropteridine reductase [Candidatus Methanofastidiosum methylothiophilum]|uniref:Dihydropteridine reductase n=1 Tax=Candidatus Methanofastidiosum methylothiophilum TaxID=1705564 RepID=A0A150IP55_9EURY|nr:MAG: dihydropteridine reductase [Candidatus Methanofastidiosum methylthiophilus]KYC46846.1 MAG: dihydropteridine reductase [Candidatus Methanofastidiosum methylthiophilus]KYC49010.1 MAG: dihydropteridine reductase [Candidatus Methanofastidiosum methylthiophilus]